MSAANEYEPLPLSWYFEPSILESELRSIFSDAPRYAGCVGMLREDGAFRTIAECGHAERLVRDGRAVRLLANVCAHRGMLMGQGSGIAATITCPLHRWTYDLRGKLIAAPHYPACPDAALAERSLVTWNGILFTGNANVARTLEPLSGRPELDVGHYDFAHHEEEEQPVNWKIPVEILLENYHLAYVHPGFRRYLHPDAAFTAEGCHDDERLVFQQLAAHPELDRNPASPAFEAWQQAILRANGGSAPMFGALIALLFPNVFLEWYPFLFAVTTYTPRAPGRTLMTRDFFVAPDALAASPRFFELAKRAWDETQQQDDAAHYGLQAGRAARYRWEPTAASGHALYQSPSEDSLGLWHEVLRRRVGGLGGVPAEGRRVPSDR